MQRTVCKNAWCQRDALDGTDTSLKSIAISQQNTSFRGVQLNNAVCEIFFLFTGRIVERGNHNDLIQMKGHYWRMCKGQEMA